MAAIPLRFDVFALSFRRIRHETSQLGTGRFDYLLGKTAGMAQHVGMHGHRQPSLLAVLVQQQVDGRAVQGLASLTEEERPPWCLQPRSLHQPGLERVISIPLECDSQQSHS